MGTGDVEATKEGEIFASSQIYFPILITRHSLDAGIIVFSPFG